MMEIERRDWTVDRLEIRGHGDGRTVSGQAVPINRLSDDLGGFREVIRPGAVTESVRNNDIVMLWQHDTAQPISKTTARNHPLVLEERKTGLWFEQPAAAFTDFQLSKIDDGVVDKMSFGFFVEDREHEKWHEDQTPVLREIFVMNLKEISPVTFAAYNSTKVALRHAAEHGVVLPELVPCVTQGLELDCVAHGARTDGTPGTRGWLREYPSASAFKVLRTNGHTGLQIRAAAFHESGHATVAYLRGERLDAVCLYSVRRPGDVRWTFTGGACWFSNNPRHDAVTFRAGAAAEELAGLGLKHLPSDWRASDNRRANALTQHGDQQDTRAAKALLKFNWSAVKALAHRLLEDQLILGEAAEELILLHLHENAKRSLMARRVA